MIREAQAAVLEFHVLARFDVPERITALSDRVAQRRIDWITSELEELRLAPDAEAQADAIADILYFAIGAFVEMGVDGDEVFELVHKANMEKIGGDVSPRYGPDGKLLKPLGWSHPRITLSPWSGSK